MSYPVLNNDGKVSCSQKQAWFKLIPDIYQLRIQNDLNKANGHDNASVDTMAWLFGWFLKQVP